MKILLEHQNQEYSNDVLSIYNNKELMPLIVNYMLIKSTVS